MERAQSSQRATGVKPYKQIVHSADRNDWLKARALALGASESSTVMGLNPYESEYTLFMRRTGRLPPIEDSEPMEWGRRLEDVIATKFADETGRKVWGGGWMLQSTIYPWLSATPDREQRDLSWDEDGLLEIKAVGTYAADDWRDEPPVYYQCQLQHQLLVTGLRLGSICALIGGQSFVWRDIERHERFCKTLLTKTERFWQRVTDDDPPLPDDSPSTSSTLLSMVERGEAILLPEKVIEWHLAAKQAAADEKEAKERKDEYRRKILATLGEAAYGVLPGEPFGCNGVYKCITETRKAYSVPEGTSRTLRYKKKLEL